MPAIPMKMTEAQTALCARALVEIRDYEKRTIADVEKIGALLLTVREGLKHGDFLLWINQEVRWSDRTAQNYMNVARKLKGKSEMVSGLKLSTIYKIAALPEEKTTELLNLITDPINPPSHKIEEMIVIYHVAEKAKGKRANTLKGEASMANERIDPEQEKRRAQERDKAEQVKQKRLEEAEDFTRSLDKFACDALSDLIKRYGAIEAGQALADVLAKRSPAAAASTIDDVEYSDVTDALATSVGTVCTTSVEETTSDVKPLAKRKAMRNEVEIPELELDEA